MPSAAALAMQPNLAVIASSPYGWRVRFFRDPEAAASMTLIVCWVTGFVAMRIWQVGLDGRPITEDPTRVCPCRQP